MSLKALERRNQGRGYALEKYTKCQDDFRGAGARHPPVVTRFVQIRLRIMISVQRAKECVYLVLFDVCPGHITTFNANTSREFCTGEGGKGAHGPVNPAMNHARGALSPENIKNVVYRAITAYELVLCLVDVASFLLPARDNCDNDVT